MTPRNVEPRRITARNWPKRSRYRIMASVVQKLSSLYEAAPSKKLIIEPKSKTTRVATIVPSARPTYSRRVISVSSAVQSRHRTSYKRNHAIRKFR